MARTQGKKRQAMLSAKDARCWFCGRGFDPGKLNLPSKGQGFYKVARKEARPTIEHLLPLSRGGTNESSNCVLAHSACNVKAGAMTLDEKLALKDALHREPLDFTALVKARSDRKILANMRRQKQAAS